MSDNSNDNGMWRYMIVTAFFVLAMFLMFIFQGCTTVRTVTEYRDSIVYRAVHDTTIIRQTDSVDRWRSGDTVFLTRWRVREVERVRHDTISDTQVVKEPYEVEVVRERVPAWCWWLVAVVGAFVVYKVGRLALKIYTQGRV